MRNLGTRIAKLEEASGSQKPQFILSGIRVCDPELISGAVTKYGIFHRESDEPLAAFQERYFATLPGGVRIVQWVDRDGNRL